MVCGLSTRAELTRTSLTPAPVFTLFVFSVKPENAFSTQYICDTALSVCRSDVVTYTHCTGPRRKLEWNV